MVRFALCDVDGLYLANPGDELTINEPSGFRDLIMNLQRDEEYRGVSAEFGEGDTELGFSWNIYTGVHGNETYSPHTLLQFILENAGADGKVFLRYYTVQGSVETLDYEWALVFKAVEEVDDKIFFRVRKEDFGDKLRTRFETDVNVAGTKDLDDNTVSAVSLITLPLHSRLQRLRVDADSEVSLISSYQWDMDDPTAIPSPTFYGTINFSLENINEFSRYTPVTEEIKITSPITDENVTLRTDFKGKTTIAINLAFDFGAANTSPDIYGNFGGNYDFRILLVVQSVLGTVKHTETVYNGDGSVTDFSSTPVAIETTINESYTYTDIAKDDEVFLYWYFIPSFVTTEETPFPSGLPILADTGLTFTQDSGTLEITQLTEFPPSTIEGNFIFEILNDSLKKSVGATIGTVITANIVGVITPFINGETVVGIAGGHGTIQDLGGSLYLITILSDFNFSVDAGITGNTSGASGNVASFTLNSLLDSSLLAKIENVALTDGAASLNFVTTGKRIRQLPGAPLNVSNAKLIDFVRCRYNAGFIITEDSDGAKKVVVQRAADFFNEVEITSLENVETPTTRKLNNNLLYNEFEAGYIKYAKENENNSIEGFNTKRNWLLPLEKEKKKLSLIAPVITDGAEIERVRRLEINQDESDQSDDEIFIIKCSRISSTTPVSSVNYDTARNYIDIDDADNKIYLKGFYLEGQLNTATEITLAVTLFSTTTQTITINSVTYDAENNQTIINTTEIITAADGNYTTYSFYFNVDVFMPERLESFSPSFTTGIIDKYSEYNLDHAPSNFLFEWFNFIGAPLESVAGTKVVKFTQGVNNNDVSRRYATGAGFFTTSQILESADWLMSSLRSYNPAIFTKYEHEIVCYLTHAEFLQVRKSLLGMLSDASNYGYVSFTDNFGNLVQIWPTLIRRNPTTDRTEIVGWQKSVVNTGTFYILQETGDKIYREDSSGFLLRESASEVPSGGIIETEDSGGFLTEDGGFFELEG